MGSIGALEPKAFRMNGGDGAYSYTKNSHRQGSTSEAKVDSFNLPVYAASPKEMKKLVEINGCFYIEKMESTGTRSKIDGPVNMKTLIEQLRAGFEGIFAKRFGSEIIDELFDRTLDKIVEISSQFEPGCMQGTQLFLALKRK